MSRVNTVRVAFKFIRIFALQNMHKETSDNPTPQQQQQQQQKYQHQHQQGSCVETFQDCSTYT